MHDLLVVAGEARRAAIADGLAIVGFRGKAVEAFAAADGSRAWRRPMRGPAPRPRAARAGGAVACIWG